MRRAEKVEVIDGLRKDFAESGGIILLSFQGINVPDITELRQKVREANGRYAVVKNTLAIRAAEGTAVDSLKEEFTGPTAIAFTSSDPVSLAKVLKEFVKSHPGMAFKAAVLEGRAVSQNQVEGLADLPSREALLAKLLYLLNAPLTRLATALKSPVRNLAVVMSELAKKKQ